MHIRSDFHVIELNNSDLKTRNYRKRKQHTKLRSGCFTCRAKRVKVCQAADDRGRDCPDWSKCDEAKPTCFRCRRNNRSCSYEQPRECETLGCSSYALVPPSRAHRLSPLSAVTLAPDLLPSAMNGTSNVRLIQHFHQHWDDMFHMPGKSDVMSLSQSEPLVRNVVLAIAACHLRHLSPGVLEYRIAEHFQQSLVLENYQQAINRPLHHLGQSGVNVLLLVGSLLNILAFALPKSEIPSYGEPDYSTSWIFSTRDDRLDWLNMQIGMKSLIRSTAAYLDGALDFIGPLLLGPDKESWAFGGVNLGVKSVPETWAKVFGLDEPARGSEHKSPDAIPGNLFRQPIMLLVSLRDLEPVPSNLFRNFQFLGKVQYNLRVLLHDRDVRALWVLGYWLGLLCRYEGIWWCSQRVRRDHKAIHVWFEQLNLPTRPGVEGDLWNTLMKELEMAPFYSYI